MKSPTRSTRLLLGAAAVFATLVLGACTPNEIAAFNTLGPDGQQAVLDHLAFRNAQAEDKFSHVVSEAGLARLRACESNGNYSIVSASGAYRGAYQFHRGTWNGVARTALPAPARRRPRSCQPGRPGPHGAGPLVRAWSPALAPLRPSGLTVRILDVARSTRPESGGASASGAVESVAHSRS